MNQLSGLQDFSLQLYDGGTAKGEIPFVQATNFSFENSKLPIYNFSSEKFQQVAKGKELVQGLIVLKQAHVEFLTSIAEEVSDNESKALERRLAKYSSETRAYLEGILKEIDKRVSGEKVEEVKKTSVMGMCLKLLKYKAYEIKLIPTKKNLGEIGYVLEDVHFTKVRNANEITNGSGDIIMEFFCNYAEV